MTPLALVDAIAGAEILASAGEAWIAVTPDGAIAGLNPAGERTFGWSSHELLGREFAEVILPEESREIHRRELARFRATGKCSATGRRIEVACLHRDGHMIDVEVSVATAGAGESRFLHGFLHDVTERRRLSRHLEAQRAVSDVLAQPLEVTDLLHTVAFTLAEALDCEVAVLWTRQADGRDPVPALVLDADSRPGSGPPPDGGEASELLSRAWSRGRPVASRPGDGYALWLPISESGEVIAVIEMRTARPQRLDERATGLLGAVALQIGQVLEQRRSAARVLELAEQNRRILEASSEGVIVLDETGTVTYSNAAASAILGTSAQDLRGREVHEIVHGEDFHPGKECPLARAIRQGATLRFADERFQVPGRTPRLVEGASSPLRNGADGTGAVLSFREVTERREFEAARLHDLQFLHSLLDSMVEGVAACDSSGRLTLFNRAMQEMRGRPVLPLSPDKWAAHYGMRDAQTGELMETERLPMVRALGGETVRELEMLYTSPDETTRVVRVNARQLADADGRILGAVGVAHDVTEQRTAERRMEEAERLAAISSFELNLDTRELSWSPGLYRIVGLEPEVVAPTEEAWQAVMHPDDVAPAYADLERALAEDLDEWESEYRILRSDGQVRRIRSRSELVRDSGGNAARVRGTVQDHTEQAEAEATLRRTEARARQSDRMDSLGQLAGGVAHDFNNLLAVILSYSEFVLEDLPEASATRGDVEEIRKAAQRAANLTRRLLVFSRREVVRPQNVDMIALVRDLEGLLARTLGEQIEVVVAVPDRIEPVSADPGQLEQMLINLALNARDAMPDGGTLRIEVAQVEVTAGCQEELAPGHYLRMRVGDTGVGMPPDVAAHIFEPFFTTKLKGHGTGLGLATVYGVVNEAGGSIGVTSELGAGSVFSVHLPVAPADPPMADDDLAVGSVSVPSEPQLASRRVLVVEDDAAVRRVSCRILEQAGYAVSEAGGAAEALDLLEACDGRIDLLLSDVIMPGGSGWDLHTQVGERWPGIPTLFMSGYTDDLVGRERLAAADVEFIAKPFTAAGLLACVAGHVR